ncbi:MAG: hypothetical protein V3V14_02780 [Saprospiraceae bacterium]
MTLFSLCFTNITAQINFKVGTVGAYVQAKENKSILNSYSENSPKHTNGYGSLDYIIGLQGGLRYTIGAISLESTYQTMKGSVMASANYGTTEFIERSLYYTFSRIDLGFEHKIMEVGYGASIGYSFLNIQFNTNLIDTKLNILDDYVLNSQFHISFHLAKMSILEVVLKPYVEIAWDDYNMINLDKSINKNSAIVRSELLDRIHMVGLSLAFYNGGQN